MTESTTEKLYRVQIELKSPLATALKGDTVWGHAAWGIANHEGEEGIAAFLDDCRTAKKAFVVSSAFPRGTVCKGMSDIPPRKETLSPDDYAQIKKAKKEKYESAAKYFEIAETESGKENPFSENVVTHNTISRLTNTVEEGGLYAVKELWAKGEKHFDIYVLSSYTKERVRQIFDWAFENGFGADASTGKGAISVLGVESVKPKLFGNKYMALSPFVADLNEIKLNEINLKADIFVRSGKIGGAYSSYLAPWKKTAVLYDEGAVFESKKPLQYVGKLLENMHSEKKICQSAFAPVIPIE